MAHSVLKPALLLLGLLLAACERGQSGPAGPPPTVVSALAKGVNLSHWFTFRDEDAKAADRYQITAADLRWIAESGFGHVRIPFDPSWLLSEDGRGLHPQRLAEFRQAIEQAQAQNLLVVITLQPDSAAKQRIAQGGAALTAAARFWSSLAESLVDLPSKLLVFEALNEPEIESATQSRAVVGQLADAIRAVAPRHTIVVSGHRWSSLPELVALEPYADRNRVYSFHFYDPHNFTHQGADWGWPMWYDLAGLPYPSSPEAVTPLLKLLPQRTHPHVLHYGEERWNRRKIAGLLDQAAAYAQRHNVFVWCSEFGVFRYNAAEADRRAWLWDVRTLLEERKLGWSHWDYAGRFGLVTGEAGSRTADLQVVEALGLRPPA